MSKNKKESRESLMNENQKRLFRVKEEILTILKKNELMGAIVIADGKSHGEFALDVHSAEWSNIKLVKLPDDTSAYDASLKLASDNESATRTVNGVSSIIGMLGHVFILQKSFMMRGQTRLRLKRMAEK